MKRRGVKPEAMLLNMRNYGSDFLSPPDPLPRMAVSLPFVHSADSAWNKGTLNWTVADSVVNVTDDEGNDLGHIQACFGGFLEVHVNRQDGGFAVWRLDPREAWRAVTEALTWVSDSGTAKGQK